METFWEDFIEMNTKIFLSVNFFCSPIDSTSTFQRKMRGSRETQTDRKSVCDSQNFYFSRDEQILLV